MEPNSQDESAADCGVVIVAGGSGTRMGSGSALPKQFMPLAGRALFLWSIEFFGSQPSVGEIVVAAPQALLDQARRLISETFPNVAVKCVAGGKRRQDSVLEGLMALSTKSAIAAVHDAARPFPPQDFEAAVATVRSGSGVIFAAPVTDSLKQVADGVITGGVPREKLWAAQTPQIFRKDLLIEALEKCESHGTEVTDEAAAMEFAGYPAGIAEGGRSNIKITVPEDFLFAELLAAERARA